MPYIDATVNVDLSDFDLDDLIREVEDNGFTVLENDDPQLNDSEERLTEEEIQFICRLVSIEPPGTFGWNIYEKLRKRS